MRPFASYLSTVVLLLITVIGSVMLANAYVDPEEMLYTLNINNNELIRYEKNGSHREKASKLYSGTVDLAILGSSRVMVGIDPAHYLLADRRAYNAGLAAASLYEIHKVFDFAMGHNTIREIIFGIDFFMFNTHGTVGGEYEDSLFANTSPTQYLKYICSISTFKKTVNTLRRNLFDKPKTYSDERGFYDKTGKKVNHRKKFREVLAGNFLVRPNAYGAFAYGTDRVDLLEQMLSRAAQGGVEFYLFISPMHARQVEALAALGLYEQFRNWKRDLVQVVDRVNARHGSNYRLWDFSGYNEITSEEVPSEEEPLKAMRWYIESSHYKKETGNQVISRLLGQGGDGLSMNFGVILTRENIEAHLREERIAQERYRQTQPHEFAEVQMLTRQTQSIRTRLGATFLAKQQK